MSETACRGSQMARNGFLGRVYEMRDFEPPAAEVMARLQAIIDEAFGRGGAPAKT